jgi:hypothetical protein
MNIFVGELVALVGGNRKDDESVSPRSRSMVEQEKYPMLVERKEKTLGR